MTDAGDWSTNSTAAFHIRQVQAEDGKHKAINKFGPGHTYQLFDDESIFGYKGLEINLLFNSSDMRPNVQITYKKKFKAVGDTEPFDIEEKLAECLPQIAFDKISAFDATINDPVTKSFKPEGTLYKSETTADGVYEYYKTISNTPAAKQLLTRLQILDIIYIEGGQALDPDEWDSGKWSLYTVYKKSLTPTADQNPYVFCGYATVYSYHPISESVTPPCKTKLNLPFPYPADKEYSVPVRARISQFIILPPYQRQQLGSKLYGVIYKNLLKDPSVFEITVEDPSQEFDDLRDLCDLTYLRASVPEFLHLRINASAQVPRKGRIPYNAIIDTKDLEAIRLRTKIAPRQFLRLVEMHLLSTISPSVRLSLTAPKYSKKQPTEQEKREKASYRLWNLIVKQRLYKHNRDALVQVEREERIEKLEETARGVEIDYVRILEKGEEVKRRRKEMAGRAVSVGAQASVADVKEAKVKEKEASKAELPEKEKTEVPSKNDDAKTESDLSTDKAEKSKLEKTEFRTGEKRSAPSGPEDEEKESKKARVEDAVDSGK